MTLTDEEIRIKVAEAMGWSNISHHKIHAGNEGLIGSHIAKDGVPSRDWVPNYPGDLNACAEFEAHAYRHEPSGWFDRYKDELEEQCSKLQHPHWNPICAPARQRCLAYLKTKGILP